MRSSCWARQATWSEMVSRYLPTYISLKGIVHFVQRLIRDCFSGLGSLSMGSPSFVAIIFACWIQASDREVYLTMRLLTRVWDSTRRRGKEVKSSKDISHGRTPRIHLSINAGSNVGLILLHAWKCCEESREGSEVQQRQVTCRWVGGLFVRMGLSLCSLFLFCFCCMVWSIACLFCDLGSTVTDFWLCLCASVWLASR